MSLYNTYKNMPKIPYKIVEKLATSDNENFWKALYYNDYDCLSKKNLTFKEKTNLVWKNQADEQQYKIFLKPLIPSELTKVTTQLRINRINTKPTNQYKGILIYEFIVLIGDKMALIDVDGIPTPRVDYLEQQILEILNGADIGVSGLNIFQFNREIDRENQSRLSISNSKSFFGVAFNMGVQIMNLEEDDCG